MTDVAVSYASATKDRTRHVVDLLRAAGLDVWIDDVGRTDVTLTDMRLPAGQRHWDVISAALDRASLVLVLDSRWWRESGYCQREYKHAREAGKRIGVIPLDDIDGDDDGKAPRPTVPIASIEDVRDQVHAGRAVAAAHTRLLVAARADTSLRLGSPTLAQLARDVERLAAADLTALGLRAPPDIAALTAEVVRLSRRWRQVRRRAAATAIGVLATAAVVAVAARNSAMAARDRAVTELAFRESLRYAEESRQAVGSADRVALAEAAVEAAPTTAALAASAEAAAFAAERSRFMTALGGTPLAVALDDDARTVAVLTITQQQATRTIASYDATDGSLLGRADVPVQVMPELALGPEATTATVASLDGSALVTVDLAGGAAETIPTRSVVAFGYWDGRLWWAEASGDMFVIDPHRGEQVQLAAGEPIRAAAIDHSRNAPVVLTHEGWLRRFAADASGSYREDADLAVQLFDGPPAVERGDGLAARVDWLLVCGPRTIAFRPDGWAAVDSRGTQERATINLALERQGWLSSSRACVDDSAVRIQTSGTADSVPADRAIPTPLMLSARIARYPMASAARADALTVVQPDGLVDVIRVREARVARTMDDVVAVLPFDGRFALVTASGRMFSVGPRLHGDLTPFGDLGRPPTSSFATRLGDSWVLGVPDGYVEVLPDGSTVPHDFDEVGRLRPTANGTALMAVGEQIVEFRLGDAGDIVGRTTVAGLEPGEELYEADDLAAGTRAVTTTRGRVLVVDARSGEVRAARDDAPGGQTPLVVISDGSIVTAGADGIVRAYDADLRLVRSTAIGPPVYNMMSSDDGERLVVATLDGDAHVLDAATLGRVFGITDEPEHRVYSLASDDRTLTGLTVERTVDGYDTTITASPLRTP